ncbi:MAG: hypothetical protein IJ308_04125 [Clostridia bacterium]|nr:hypothetical protein [Clostridia bacterium]
MRKTYNKNTVRYFALITVFFVFLFFTTDFGLIDIQKTAIVLAVGIDRDEQDFIISSQIAIPKSSDQGQATNAVQIVSRGKTVAEAFEDINAKTGWYPKLVFCNLLLLGEETVKQNVFDALDYFLMDEYLSDNCLVATCNDKASDLLNATALVDDASSAAIEKVLSPHAERVGSVFTSTLHTFAMGYYSDNACGMLPIVKLQNQQEPNGETEPKVETPPNQGEQSGGEGGGSEQGGQSGGQKQDSGANASQNKPVFSAGETALFKHGKKVGALTPEETFAANAVLNKLRLAPYSVTTPDAETPCSLSIKQNAPKIKLKVAKNGMASLKIHLTLTAGILDYAKARPVQNAKDVGNVPAGAFSAAQKKLAGEILALFEKTRALDCDVFSLRDRYRKTGNPSFSKHEASLLQNTVAEVDVHFQNVR